MKTETYLVLVIAVLVVALVIVIALGRMDAQDADRLARVRDRQGEHIRRQRIQLRHKQDRIQELRDELDAFHHGQQRGGRQLTAEWTAFVSSLPVTDPKDPR